MERIAALRQRYAWYEETVRELQKTAKPFAGIFGWGDDPRNDLCHVQFYEDIGTMTAQLEDAEEAVQFAAARWLIAAPTECAVKEALWFQLAAQGHCKLLIPRLTPAHRRELKELFDQRIPRRQRLPVQEEVYKLLGK